MTDLNGISVVPAPSAAQLNQRQQLDYRSRREACLSWLLAFGKDPKRAEGYAYQTVKSRAYRMDHFYRWVWEQEGGYTADVTHDHADAWMRALAHEDKSNAHKANGQKAAKMLFKWREHEHGLDTWEPTITFSEDSGTSNPRDYLTIDERQKLREAALELGTIPAYGDLSPDQRDRWRAEDTVGRARGIQAEIEAKAERSVKTNVGVAGLAVGFVWQILSLSGPIPKELLPQNPLQGVFPTWLGPSVSSSSDSSCWDVAWPPFRNDSPRRQPESRAQQRRV